MSLDTVDIGGAAAYGRPDMPPMVTVDEAGTPLESPKRTPEVTPAVTPEVARATASTPIGSASPAYPAEHPANTMDVSPDGALILTKENEVRKFDKYTPLGDVQKGYVTGRRKPMDGSAPDYQDAARELEKEVQQLQTQEDRSAKNTAGEPMIEVLFHLDIGVIASYHTKVVESDKWLILIDSADQASKQKFVPRPSDPPAPVDISIVGKDKQEQHRTVLPLGINFSVDDYDFFVMMVVPKED